MNNNNVNKLPSDLHNAEFRDIIFKKLPRVSAVCLFVRQLVYRSGETQREVTDVRFSNSK